MSRPPYRPQVLRGRCFLGREALDDGVLTRAQLMSSAWRRIFRGVYVDSSLDVTYDMRCRAAAAYLIDDETVLAGRSAAMVYGVGLARPLDPIEILVPRAAVVAPYTGIVLHRGDLADEDRAVRDDLPVTSPVRTCWDLARWLPPVEAVAHIDRILRAGLVTAGQLKAYLDHRCAERPHPRGWRRYASVLPLLDGRAESPQESRLRVRFVLAGLPPPVAQFEIRTVEGRFVARVDLAWPEFRLAVEYDGWWHDETRKQLHHDRKRIGAVQLQDWLILPVTSERLRTDFDGIVADVRAAMRLRRP